MLKRRNACNHRIREKQEEVNKNTADYGISVVRPEGISMRPRGRMGGINERI